MAGERPTALRIKRCLFSGNGTDKQVGWMENTRQPVSSVAQWLVTQEEIRMVVGPNPAATELKTLVSIAFLCFLRILQQDLLRGHTRTS